MTATRYRKSQHRVASREVVLVYPFTGIDVPVSPVLELTEISRRVLSAGGPALLCGTRAPLTDLRRHLGTLYEAIDASPLGDQRGLHRWVMAEVPSIVYRIPEYAEMGIDGVSIGSNDLTQLTLGLDRDSALVAHLFDERNPAILKMLSLAIQACKKQNKYVGICGQGPSDYPDLAAWLLEQGISSLSLNPDTVIESWLDLAQRQRS